MVESTRLATFRLLLVSGKHDIVVKYQSTADHALRAAMDVLTPGAQAFQVDALSRPKSQTKADRVRVAPVAPDTTDR